ncbi:MAG: ATP-binding protein [Candidatus Acidiferrales bacterium]
MNPARVDAKNANHTKGELLEHMSREILRPINRIIEMIELALDSGLTSEQAQYLYNARASAWALLAITGDITDIVHIEAGNLPVNVIAYDLRKTLIEMMKMFTIKGKSKGLELRLTIKSGIPSLVVGDPFRLRQILVNLLGNALKFTVRGEIVVEVWKETEINGYAIVHFAVRDTGIGIPNDLHQLIFDTQLRESSTSILKFGRMGLGLPISKCLVNSMGGRIWVESEVGIGSTFHFTARLNLGPQAI